MFGPRRIHHQPKISPLSFLRAPSSVAGISAGSGALLSRGRDALHLAYRRVAAGPWTVSWFPAFHCGAEVQAAISAGWEVDFFPVDQDLRIDRDALRARLSERPGPVTLIHYFGHPARDREFVADLCRRLRIPLIEDACHGPLTEGCGGPYSPLGDAVALSLRKLLGSPDGGLLHLFSRRLTRLPGIVQDEPLETARRRLRPLVEYLRSFVGFPTSTDPEHPAAGGETEESRAGRFDPDGGWGRRISILSEVLVRRAGPEAVVERRRANWRVLRDRLAVLPGFRPVFTELHDAAVPLSMALRVTRREELVRRLHRAGVGTYVFGRWAHPALPPRSFPRARHLRREILGLPVHHGLTSVDLDRMHRLLQDLLPEHAVESRPSSTRRVPGDSPPSDSGETET